MITSRLHDRGTPRRTGRRARDAGFQQRLQGHGTPPRVARKMHRVVQLRLQARDKATRSGLAGPSLTRKEGFGLALKRSDGEHHHARGGVASNRTRDTVSHASRGGPRTAVTGRLEEWCYWDERERERERCISSAEASTYGPVRARGDPWHVCPQLTHAKTTPHHAIRVNALSQGLCPAKALEVDPDDRYTPNPIYWCPASHPWNTMNTYEHSVNPPACQERTIHAPPEHPPNPPHVTPPSQTTTHTPQRGRCSACSRRSPRSTGRSGRRGWRREPGAARGASGLAARVRAHRHRKTCPARSARTLVESDSRPKLW